MRATKSYLIATLLMSRAAIAEPLPDAAALTRLNARLAPVELKADLGPLPANERAALAKIVEAGARSWTPCSCARSGRATRRCCSTWSPTTRPWGARGCTPSCTTRGPGCASTRTRPFLPGVGDKPPAGNFYPAGRHQGEVEAWMNGLPAAEQHEAASGFFTTIRRGPDGKFQSCPTASSTRASWRGRPSCCSRRRR